VVHKRTKRLKKAGNKTKHMQPTTRTDTDQTTTGTQPRAFWQRALWFVLVMLGLGVLWHVAHVQVDERFLPAPLAVFERFAEELRGDLIAEFLISGRRVLVSVGIGVLIAAPLALLAAQFRPLDRLITPVMYFAYPAPKVVFLPLIISFLGLGDESRVFLIALVIVFQVYVIIHDAAGQVPAQTLESIGSLGANRWHLLRYVYLPVSVPAIITALKISVGTAIAVLFIAESIAGSTGLGYYIVNAWNRFNYETMYAGILAMSLLGLILFVVFDRAEAYLTRWQRH